LFAAKQVFCFFHTPKAAFAQLVARCEPAEDRKKANRFRVCAQEGKQTFQGPDCAGQGQMASRADKLDTQTRRD